MQIQNHTIFGKFELGTVLVTQGVLEDTTEDDRLSALTRHAGGDWGVVSPSDIETNNEALEAGDRLFSTYISACGTRFWVITEDDRSATTLLLPEEY